MPKKPAETWQPPLLLDLGGGKKPADDEPVEQHVEYDTGVRRRPKTEPKDDSPWWQRVNQVKTEPHRGPPPTLSWGALWLKLMASEGWTEGMRPGQRLVLENSVRGLDMRPGVIEAASASAKTKPQRVQLRMPALTSSEWARLVRQVIEDDADEEAQASLTDGRIPMSLVDAADRHGSPLLPRRLTLLLSACTCGGAQLPCDHVLAIHLAVSRKLETEPLAVLAFRGGQPEELLELFTRIRHELKELVRPAAVVAQRDPFAIGNGPPPPWELLEGLAPQRPPLPLPEGWRARETLDAMTRRILAAVRAKL